MMNEVRFRLLIVIISVWSVAASAQTRKDIRIPDVPGYVTLKCDFHMHTMFSDGEVWPTVRVKEAWREGLDAIAVTDHIEYQPHKADVPTKPNRSFQIAQGPAHDADIILIHASEITRSTPPGHYNALFLKDSEALYALKDDFKAMMKEAARQQAFVFWNHHAWKGENKGKWTELQTELVKNNSLHGMEVINDGDYYPNALNWCAQKNLVMLGNSDIHRPSLIQDSNQEHRSITLVFARQRNEESLRKALFAGQTAVWNEDKVYGPERWLRALADTIITTGKPFHIKGNTWGIYVSNHSCIPLEMTRVGQDGPARISLPADSTALARFTVEGEPQDTEVSYKINNFWIKDQTPLVIQKTITGF